MKCALEIDLVHPNDYSAIAEIHREAFVATYSGIAPGITAEAVQNHTSGDWSDRKAVEYREQVDSDGALIFVGRLGGAAVGFCMVRRDMKGGSLYCDPAYRNTIIGPHLILTAGRNLPVNQDLTVTVVPNTPAVRFYNKLGLQPTHRNLTNEFPKLKGGQILPLVELALHHDEIHPALMRLEALLLRKNDKKTL